jgi:hypothetical protein
MIVGSAHIATSVFVAIVIVAALYFVPSIVAQVRRHHRRRAIFLVNLFLGWSLIGWIGALWWACTDPHPRHPVAPAPTAAESRAPPAPPAD